MTSSTMGSCEKSCSIILLSACGAGSSDLAVMVTRNQLADGSWFAPTRAVPVQPHTFESFPNGWHQFVSDAASCWATMALLFTLSDKPHSSN